MLGGHFSPVDTSPREALTNTDVRRSELDSSGYNFGERLWSSHGRQSRRGGKVQSRFSRKYNRVF